MVVHEPLGARTTRVPRVFPLLLIWAGVLATPLVGCGRDTPGEYDHHGQPLGQPHHGTLTQRAVLDTEMAIDQQSRLEYQRRMDTRLTGIESWMDTVLEDDRRGVAPLDPQTRLELQEVEQGVREVRQELQAVDAVPREAPAEWERQARAQHNRLMEIEQVVASIGARRTAPPVSQRGLQ